MTPLALLLFTALDPEPERLVVLSSISAGTTITDREVYTLAERALAHRARLRLLESEDLFAVSAERLSTLVGECGSDRECVVDRLAPLDADWVLVVVVSAMVSPPLLSLELRSLRGEADLFRDTARIDGPLDREIEARLRAALDQAGIYETGWLEVLATPADATVKLDGEVAGRGPVRAGQHTVEVSFGGFRTETRAITVAPGERARWAVTLEEESSIASSPWLWIGVGAAVLAGAGLAAGLASSGSACWCLARPGATCPPCP